MVVLALKKAFLSFCLSSFILIFASIVLWLPQPIKCFLFLNLYCFQFIFSFFQFLVLCSADVGSEGGSGCLILRQRPNCSLSRPSSHFVAIWPSDSLKSSNKIVTKIVVRIYMEILHCSFSLWAWKDINCEINVS